MVLTLRAPLLSEDPVDVGTGTSTTRVSLDSSVYLGISQSKPCPRCDGGICNGGARDGLACTPDALHSLFGATSLDCPPLPGQLFGQGHMSLALSDAPAPLGEGVPCTIGGGFQCACAYCSGDTDVPCSSDAECTGIGTCTSIGDGVPTAPNSCSDLVCTDGECSSSASKFKYCDGFVEGDGTGVLSCTTNADCDIKASECPDNACGTCSIVEAVSCFTSGSGTETISAPGEAGIQGGVLGAVACAAHSGVGFLTGLGGMPGPVRIAIATHYEPLCSNGAAWIPGGSSCQ